MRYSGLGVHSLDPVGDFLGIEIGTLQVIVSFSSSAAPFDHYLFVKEILQEFGHAKASWRELDETSIWFAYKVMLRIFFPRFFFFDFQDLYVWWCPCKIIFILKWELQCFWDCLSWMSWRFKVPLVTLRACREQRQLKISGLPIDGVEFMDGMCSNTTRHRQLDINGMIQLALILVNSLCI